MQFTSKGRTLSLSGLPYIVGILNVTPDSFYDGGKYTSVQAAIERASTMLEEGASIIDVGGQSTGPGSKDISLEEELSRVIPVIEGIRNKHPDCWISVDTYTSQVASEALKAGADIINDITALRADPAMAGVIARANAGVILMYSKDPSPRTTTKDVSYSDVTETVLSFLRARKAVAIDAGILEAGIIVDPGLGHFVSSEASYSFTLLTHLRILAELNPVLASPSRKSFLRGPNNLPPSERLPATIEASLMAARNGASFLRTHDVAALKEALDRLTFSLGY